MSEIELLQIAPRFSGNPTSGAEFRNFHLGAGLARHMRVTHAGFLPADAAEESIPGPGNTFPNHRFIAVPRGGSYRRMDLVRGLAGRVPFSVLNYTRAEMRETIEKLMAERPFDIALVEGIHLGEYLPQLRAAGVHVVCDWHNIESEILQRYSQGQAGWARRQYARHSAQKLAAYERWFVNRCDLHVVVSERDRDMLLQYGAEVPIIVIENGVPVDQFNRAEGSGGAQRPRFRVIFTGAMDYHANIDAVTAFAQEVWPELHASVPELVFTIVGRNPSAEVRALRDKPGIEVTGVVKDVRPYYSEAAAAVMPLTVGGGTRIKILEAMAAGVPVISTSLGAEGLAAIPGTHYLRTDSTAGMLAALQAVSGDPGSAARMVSAAREFVRRHHDWARLSDRLAEHLLALRGEKRMRATAG